MRKILEIFKKEIMLSVSLLAALISFLITPPSTALLSSIDWKTLATLFMLLSVLDGFKKENLFLPVIKLASRFITVRALSFFFVLSVFFSSMFVTNDVSLIIFVPLTIMMFRAGGKEKYTVPILVLENIAAVRGSLLTPFGSPQNLFLFSKSQISALSFMKMMFPLWVFSIVLLSIFIVFIFRKEPKERITNTYSDQAVWTKDGKVLRIVYLSLFLIIIATIVSRTPYWMYVTLFVVVILLVFDRKVFTRVDYVLLLTFLCFFVFSSSITANEKISDFLGKLVGGNEYVVSIVVSQFISNVPAAIVLWPFTQNLRGLLYGLDSAGLVSIIGSLASVINLRLYSKEYPGKSLFFMKKFEIISLLFFAIIVFPQYLLI